MSSRSCGGRKGSDPVAVVDDRLRVHGLECLRVVDASIMPTITSGSTNSPVVMIAGKAADMIAEDRRAALAETSGRARVAPEGARVAAGEVGAAQSTAVNTK